MIALVASRLVLAMLLFMPAQGSVASATDSAPVSIHESEYLNVDGARLFLMIRGADRTAPVLLWLHGGPGGAERPLFRYFNGELEDHFVVVYWDQRGAGRSYDGDADPRSLTIARHLADLEAVIDHLKQRLNAAKVVLIGHSWGSALGLLYAQRHPENVAAFIGVAQMVSTREAQQAQYDFLLAQASQRDDTDASRRLRKIGPPPYRSADQVLETERLADRYGATYHQAPRQMWVALRGLLEGLVLPWEIPKIIKGNNVSLEAMNDDLLELDLARSVPKVDVPVFFFLGRYDRHVDARLAAAYFAKLQAPLKRLVWFEHSAHGVPFEEPDLFNATVVRELHSIGIPKSNHN